MENDKPLISVIVPVHNGQDYLQKCIESIEKQTCGNLEIIIVNDGSKDGTATVCDRLRSVYPNIRVLTLQDEGVSAARNAGVSAAKGKFITFVDADDRLLPDVIERLYDCMIKTDSDVTGCQFFPWSCEAEWQQALTQEMTEVSGKPATSENLMQEFPYHSYSPAAYLKEEILAGNSRCWSKLYRRQIFDKVCFPKKLTIGEDMLFLIDMLSCVEKIVEVDYPGYGYFQNPEGTIKRKFTPGAMDQITCWKLAREKIMRMDQSLDAKVGALFIMGIMLTAGKLAVLPAKDRRKNREYVRTCHEELKKAVRIPGAYGKLTMGYRVKAGLYLVWPGLYLGLYHLHKA